MSLTRILRQRYEFGDGRSNVGKENADVSPANMTVRDAALFQENGENFKRVRYDLGAGTARRRR